MSKKEPSLKQQIIQSIANSQVQQAKQEIGFEDFSNAFNAWNADQEQMSAFQAAYDEWNKANPIEQPTVKEVKAAPVQQIPSIADYKQNAVDRAVERRQRLNKQDIENAKKVKKDQETLTTIAGISDKLTNVVPNIDALSTVTEKKPRSTVGQRPEATDTSSQLAARVTNEKKPEIDTANVPVDVERWLSPDVKLTDAEKKKAKEYASAELQKINYGPNKMPVLDNEEDRQHYADMVNLINKTNPVTNALTGALEIPYNLADMVADKGRDVGNQLKGLGKAITDKLGITEGATKRHNEEVAAAEELANQKEADIRQSMGGAKTQDPLAYGVGKTASQVAMYYVTNPVFDSIAEGAGVSSALAKFFINQGAQNVQDLVLDTAPLVNELMADGSMSEDEKREVFNNILWNAGGNLVMGGASELLKNRAVKKASDEAFRENLNGWSDRLSEIANEKIPGIEDADNVVRNATKQAEDAAKNIEDIAQQIPKLPEEEIKLDDSELKNLLGGMEPTKPVIEQAEEVAENIPKSILSPEDMDQVWYDFENINKAYDRTKGLEAIENTDFAIPNAAINQTVDKKGKTVYQIVHADTQKVIKELKSEKAAEKALADYLDGSDLKARVTKAWNDIDSALYKYEKAVYNAEDVKEVETAKKAVDAARKRYERAMKEFDPSFSSEITSQKYGQLVSNPYYVRNPQAKNPVDEQLMNELAEEWARNDFENPNRFAQDISKTPGANPLQTFAEKDNAQEQLRQLELARQRSLLDVNEELKQSLPEYYGWNLGADRAYHERIIDGLKTADEKEDEALDALTNYVNRQRNGGGNNTPTRGNNTPTPTRPIRNIGGGNGGGTTPPSNPLNNNADDQWKISKARKNTFENQGWGDQLPEKDFAYRVQSTADTHEIKNARYQDVENVANELLNKDYDTFDAADVKASMEEIQKLMDGDDVGTARRLAERLAHEGREGGRTVQAFREYNKNNFTGALRDATNAEEDLILEPWRSRNVKKREGNSRIAKALADMGHKPEAKKEAVKLTHDQIKAGVRAEIEREVGSVEKYFNDNDIEFLTQMAEDKKIPVWQITSEIEHKLNTGNWYTLDESIDLPKPTNTKLMNALNSLVTEQVRAEKPAPTLQQITEEVRNTLAKEFGEGEETLSLFGDEDVEYLANLINNGATKQELANALDHKLATGKFGISNDTLREVNAIFKEISKFDPNSKQFVDGQAEAYRLLANEILPNASLKEKFEAWRYIAMLGNPKTMLRNYIGNKTFGAVTGISNNIAAIAEAGIDKASKALGGNGIQRTKSVLNPIADSPLIKAAAEDADFSRYRQINGTKYEKMDKDSLRQFKSVFNSKAAQFYEKLTDAGISDYKAVKQKYSTSLAGYLKANGYDTNIFKAEDQLQRLKNLGEQRLLSEAEKSTMESLTKDVEALEKARDYALKQAEYATFHEDNKIANVLSKWSRTSKEEGTGIGHVLLEGVVPFKKTPANVLRSGLEYSPLGAIDSIKKTGKLIYENTGKRAGNLADTYLNKKGKEVARTFASDVIDSWAKTLTGTGLTALGYYLYNKGILHSSDPDTKYQDELEGHQNYAIEINGKSYTIDWAAPTVMPLMVGAEVAKLWNSTGKDDEDFYNNIDTYVEAANRLADPLIETSMLQGVRDTLETAASYAKNNEAINILPLLGYNVGTGYLTQAIPTLGGQVARTIDPTRRSTYTDKTGVAGVLDRQLKKQMNKIPGLSQLNQEYVDTYGRTQKNSPFNNPIGNLAYQMFSPGYLSDINETDADKISREAYNVGKTESTLPKWQSKFTDSEGNRVSPEDYTKASKAYGKANYEIRDALAHDEWFNGLEDAQKEEIVKGINTIAEHTGNAAIDPEYVKDSKPYNAYKEGGIPGLLDYYKGQNARSEANKTGFTSNSNASKAIQKDVLEGNQEAAEQKIDAAQQIQDAGLTKPGPTYTYYKAQEVIPGLSVEQFTKTYKGIDSNGNQGIDQKELLAYINKNANSESEAQKLWKAYGGWKNKKGQTKKLVVGKDGQYTSTY